MGLPPFLFRPKLVKKIWGGRRLENLLGKELPAEGRYGESWEVSAHPGDETPAVFPREHTGKTIPELARELKEDFLGAAWQEAAEGGFPLLYKFIDAEDVLSVQVHPDDDYARRDHDNGKTECWVIVATRPGSLIYRGFKEGTDLALFDRLLAAGRLEECLHSFTVEPGDVIFLPAGTVHAIGAGILLAEIQQSSDLTYRVYDWNRLEDGKPRPLHVEKAREVMRFQRPERDKEEPRLLAELPSRGSYEELVRCEKFVLERLACSAGTPGELGRKEEGRFSIFSVLEGRGRLEWRDSAEPVTLARGQSFILPAALATPTVKAEERLVALHAYVPA